MLMDRVACLWRENKDSDELDVGSIFSVFEQMVGGRMDLWSLHQSLSEDF